MSHYQIKINRKTNQLLYKGNTVEVNTRCWWDTKNEIPAGRYTSCSKTRMSGKQYEAIYLPDAQTGKSGIFIHKGTGSSSSEGCFVIPEQEMLKIWNDIETENGKNVTVIVSDGGFVV